MFSSVLRAGIFFSATASAGINAALGAMYAEFAYRSITAGFYGALTQNFRKAQPQWQATLVAGAGIPIFSHTIELSIHLMRGTPNLRANIIASVCFTIISTLFNLHAMREGVLVVGESGGSLASDMRCIPRTIASFLMSPFRRSQA
jgi:MFS superfamily sulfate permease-like transporter